MGVEPDPRVRVADDELLAALEARSASRPLLCRCPNCTRTDAMVCVQCADCGVAYFPTRPRLVYLLAVQWQKLRARMKHDGVSLAELEDVL